MKRFHNEVTSRNVEPLTWAMPIYLRKNYAFPSTKKNFPVMCVDQ